MDGSTGVMILAETTEGTLSSITRELLGAGARLAAQLGEEHSALLIGNHAGPAAAEAIAFGADRVYLAEDDSFENYDPDAYVTVTGQVIDAARPRILLLGQTSTGADLGPRLAFRFRSALSMDCVELGIDAERGVLTHTRPIYGGVAMVRARCKPGSLQMATVRAKTQDPLEEDSTREGEIIRLRDLDRGQSGRVRFLRNVPAESEDVDLEEAEVIVAGGRGVGSADNFKNYIEGLARILGGSPAASRGALDSLYAPPNLQVGLTGKIVSPRLYVAVGISGMVQHMAGCSSSKTIVGINTDPDAPIFRYSHFGVVGDFEQVVPALMDKCQELVKS